MLHRFIVISDLSREFLAGSWFVIIDYSLNGEEDLHAAPTLQIYSSCCAVSLGGHSSRGASADGFPNAPVPGASTCEAVCCTYGEGFVSPNGGVWVTHVSFGSSRRGARSDSFMAFGLECRFGVAFFIVFNISCDQQ